MTPIGRLRAWNFVTSTGRLGTLIGRTRKGGAICRLERRGLVGWERKVLHPGTLVRALAR